jgi:hypothetical protein
MANAIYDKGREGFLAGDIDWDANTIKAVLVDTGAYTVNLTTHQFLSDIASGARIATSAALASKTVTAGVADAADVTITGVTGASVEAVVIYQDTGVVGTSRLIAYLDTATSGLPLTPNGSDVLITWPNDASRIFKL